MDGMGQSREKESGVQPSQVMGAAASQHSDRPLVNGSADKLAGGSFSAIESIPRAWSNPRPVRLGVKMTDALASLRA